MSFNLEKSIEILERSPLVLQSLLAGLSDKWIYTNEGGETWSPFDIVGHLIHGEKTDWMQRIRITLKDEKIDQKKFQPFDRFAQLEQNKGKTIQQLLDEFKSVRKENIELLKSIHISENDFAKRAIHPALGEVTLQQLIATWVVHDLGHLAQIERVMARQYAEEVGPWKEYLRILH